MIKALTIGLTGQTGSGKSTVSQILSSMGFYTIDCDKISRLITEKGSPVLGDISSAFGIDVIKANGELDRALLAKRAFATKEATLILNNITHPAITKLVKKKVNGAFFNGYDVVVIDAPALFESGIEKDCDIIVSVIANEDVRLGRILKRDCIDEEYARLRIKAQHNEEYYKSKSDIIINNDSSLDALKEQISELLTLIEVKQHEENKS
ncbi:MAG: dephospho-CoA kinase [Clostridia bacterium]|nr:dephospho-CoA kinase [Clostridia bacterium]